MIRDVFYIPSVPPKNCGTLFDGIGKVKAIKAIAMK